MPWPDIGQVAGCPAVESYCIDEISTNAAARNTLSADRKSGGSHLKSRNQPSLDSLGEFDFSLQANVFLSFSTHEDKEDHVADDQETDDEPSVQRMTVLQLNRCNAGRHFSWIEWQHPSEAEYGQKLDGDGERQKTNETSKASAYPVATKPISAAYTSTHQ